MAITSLIWLIPLPPLLAFFFIVLFTNRSKALSHSLAVGAAVLSWAASMIVFIQAIETSDLAGHPLAASIPWMPTGNSFLRIGVSIDPLSTITLFFVAWTILAIFVYSIAYHNFGQPRGELDQPGFPPKGAVKTDSQGRSKRVFSVEPLYSRYFAFISLFAFAMFALVVSDNLFTLYVGWEVMGLCSYLLIGFWYGKELARNAALKAFLTTRIGDVFMLLGIAFLYSATGTLNFREIFGNPAVMTQLASTSTGVLGLSAAGLIGLLLFIGTVGKSAQWPLHVWLPDAMEGPTPVSAMIHAATMVSAGVYLAIRVFPLVSAGWVPGQPLPLPMAIMATIGGFTALFAASIALAQNDIKRVLAYSTISQLGYMVAALGIGAYAAAAFHLLTHAFFKAQLFLGSGSVIHGMEHGVFQSGEHIDTQNMFNMGGLRKKMPVTFWTFLIGGLALSGFPLVTAGFWSKDAILGSAFNGGYWLSFAALALAALLTAFYTMRLITLAFLGEARTAAARQAHESRRTMVVPLIVLSVFSIAAGWFGIPKTFPGLGGLIPDWFGDFVNSTLQGAAAVYESANIFPLLVSLVVALGGLYLGWLVYRRLPKDGTDPLQRGLGPVYKVLKNKYYFDELYHTLFVVPATWLAETFTVAWIDQGILDGALNAIAKFFLWIGSVVRNWFDIPVINGAGDSLGKGVKIFGVSLKPIQTGKIQNYMVMTVVIALVVFAAVFFGLR